MAGLSQGGYGAFSLAARHPDLFSVAGAFSGAVDIGTNPVVETLGRGVVDTSELVLDGGVEPDAAFGPPATDELNYQGHNPGTLVTNLAPLKLYLWTGNGLPGPLDTPGPGWLDSVPIEAMIHTATLSFAAVARRAGVAFHLDDYGPGTHSWPYWARDLTQFVGPLTAAFAHPAAAPTSIGYRSVERRWSQWGWTVVNHRCAALAWSVLSGAGARGFTLSGTGSATVTTAALYRPGSVHAVWIGSSPAGAHRADGRGRLTVTVPLAESGSATVNIG